LAWVLLAAFPDMNKAFVRNLLVIMTFLKSTKDKNGLLGEGVGASDYNL